MQKIAIIGLGRFGMELARQLGAAGAQVLAIDKSSQLIQEIRDHVDVAVRLDTTDRGALLSQEIDKVDVCVVAIGENFEAALLTTVLAKKLGIPRVICRAQTEFHAQIFQQIGADEVIQPEVQAGEQLARKLANPQIEDFITLAAGYTLLELKSPTAFHGKSLRALELRPKYHVNLIAIKRRIVTPHEDGPDEVRETVHVPAADEVIEPDDILVVVGPDEALSRLPKE